MPSSSSASASASASSSPRFNAGEIKSRFDANSSSNSGFIRSLCCDCMNLLKFMLQFGSMNEVDYWDIWSVDLRNHFGGEYSFAVSKANASLEDQSQVEVGKHATFIGVYDGHAGYEVATFVLDTLFDSFIEHIVETKLMSEAAIRHAISATENSLIDAVRDVYGTKPVMTSKGSCCLIGVIWKRRLYIANLGDSRAVLAYRGPLNNIVAEQLTEEHNVNHPHIRSELLAAHPEEGESLITLNKGVWRIRNTIQVSRAIGDAYLKYPELALPSRYARIYMPVPVTKAVLTAEPAIMTRELQDNDKFLIFASDGLWKHFSNEEAVEFVRTNPPEGIAKGLVEEAMKRAARRAGISYEEVKSIAVGKARRRIHDDITVVVIFIDHQLLNEGIARSTADESTVGFNDGIIRSQFYKVRRLQEWPPAA